MVLTFLAKEWKFFLVLLIVLLALGVGYYEFTKAKPVPMATIPQNATLQDVERVLKNLKVDVKPEVIVRGMEQVDQKPQYVFVTNTQQEADKKADEVAKEDKADKIIKQTETKPDGQIVNKYAGLHLEKNFKLKAGMTVGGYNSVNAGVQIKKTELIYHKSLDRGRGDSVTLMATVAEW